MRPEISPVAVALRSPAKPHMDPFEPLARVPATAGAFPAAGIGVGRGLRGLASGFGEILVVAYAIPLVILAVGIPVALLVRLGMWMAGAL